MAKTILIIDDDPDLVFLFSSGLERVGYKTLRAFDGESGLKIARENHPDLITLDVIMPELNGYSVCGFLKEDCCLRDIPIIMITGRCADVDKVFHNRYSPDAFLTKPFHMDEVLEKISSLV